MSFDGFFLHHMIEELRRELVNGRIQKINQPFNKSWSCKSVAIAKVIACSFLPIQFLDASS